MNNQINQQEVAESLHRLNTRLDNKWVLASNRIKKEFKFNNFSEALDFMVRVGRHAEDLDHHPEWCNVYNRVTIELTTHSAGGITDLDFNLASKIEEEYKLTSS